MPKEPAGFDHIADAITEAILRGKFTPDNYGRIWLPTQTQLSEWFGFSTSTVQTAMRILEARGVVIRRQGKEAQVNPEWLARASGASTEPGPDEPSPNGGPPADDPGGASTVRPHAEQPDNCR